MRNIFLKNACAKCGGETSSLGFLKKSKLSIALDQQSEAFIACPSRGLPKHIETKVLTTCFYFL